MNKTILISMLILTIGLKTSYSQEKIYLELKTNIKRQKFLNIERNYGFVTSDTMHYGKIINFTDSSLAILHWIKTNKDTTFVAQKGKEKGNLITRPLYLPDTIYLNFSEIVLLRKNLTKRQNWVAPFVYIGVGAVVHLLVLPLYPAITRGADDWFYTWAKVEGILLGVSIPPIILAAQFIKYDLVNKWTIKTK